MMMWFYIHGDVILIHVAFSKPRIAARPGLQRRPQKRGVWSRPFQKHGMMRTIRCVQGFVRTGGPGRHIHLHTRLIRSEHKRQAIRATERRDRRIRVTLRSPHVEVVVVGIGSDPLIGLRPVVRRPRTRLDSAGRHAPLIEDKAVHRIAMKTECMEIGRAHV